MATFLVGVDGSKNAQEAFDTACRLLRKEEDQLIIVTCAEKPQLPAHLLSGLHVKEDGGTLAARVEKAQKAILEPFRQQAEEKGIKTTYVLAKGHHAGRMICSLAEERNVDFLIVGRRGMNKVKRLLAGSTSKYVMEHAKCNVIVVKGYFLPEQHVSLRQVNQMEEDERKRRMHGDEDAAVIAQEQKERTAAHIGAVRDEEQERKQRIAMERIIDDRTHLCEVLEYDSE